MLKFLKLLFFRLLLLFIVYPVVIILMGNSNPMRHNLYYRIGSYGQMYSRLKDLDTTRNIDILFLGSSHSYRGFDTRIFQKAGYKTFNLGSSFQTPIQSEYLVEKYIDQLNPKLVIFEASPAAFSNNGVESTLDIISNSKITFKLFKLAFKTHKPIVCNTLIYSLYRDIFFNEKKKFYENRRRNHDTYIRGGFVEKDITYFDYKRYREQSWSFIDKQFRAFIKVMNLLSRKNITVILVQAPITSALYSSYNNNNEFDDLMKGFGTYYNYNELIQLDDSLHFYDDDHLNQMGVNIFNKAFIYTLNKDVNVKELFN